MFIFIFANFLYSHNEHTLRMYVYPSLTKGRMRYWAGIRSDVSSQVKALFPLFTYEDQVQSFLWDETERALTAPGIQRPLSYLFSYQSRFWASFYPPVKLVTALSVLSHKALQGSNEPIFQTLEKMRGIRTKHTFHIICDGFFCVPLWVNGDEKRG